jgi:uncharacterized protein (UPF0332 family)
LQPRINLRLAELLGSPPADFPEEATYRCSCGRYYYATFCVIRNLLVEANVPLETGDAHASVHKALEQSAEPRIRNVANRLRKFKFLRNEADYDVGTVRDRAFAKDDVKQAATLARQLLGVIDEVRTTSPSLGIAVSQ